MKKYYAPSLFLLIGKLRRQLMLNVFEKYLELLLGAELSFIVLDSFP